MKSKNILITALFSLFVMLCVSTVQAQTADECKDRIDLVQADLDTIYANGGIGGNNVERTYKSLSSKLQEAKLKLDRNKFADAGRKLNDFKAAVELMRDAGKPKLSLADANLLLDGNGG